MVTTFDFDEVVRKAGISAADLAALRAEITAAVAHTMTDEEKEAALKLADEIISARDSRPSIAPLTSADLVREAREEADRKWDRLLGYDPE